MFRFYKFYWFYFYLNKIPKTETTLKRTRITRACGYLTNCKDFYKDFSWDFERSDPSKTTPTSEEIERILVRILVEDFKRTRNYRITRIFNDFYYDNPKLKSSLTYATVRCFWKANFRDRALPSTSKQTS